MNPRTSLLMAVAIICLLTSFGIFALALFQRYIDHPRQALRLPEQHVEEQRQTLKVWDERIEAQEKSLLALDGRISQQQTTLQTQQEEIQKKQAEIQRQDEQIGIGDRISQQVGPNLLRDMGLAALKNERMKALLSKHGYNVQASGANAPDSTNRP